MGASRTENQDDAAREPRGEAAATPDEAPTGQLLLGGAVGDRCVNCGAPLAADQHYCIHCGERRGTSRFSPADTTGHTLQTTTPVAEPPGQGPARRPSYGTTLVAGIATLLLALGVGVEIGRISNNNDGTKAPQAQVITVNGGSGSAGSAAATSPGGTQGHTGKAKHVKAAPVKKTEVVKAQAAAAAPKPTKQAVQKASHAASSVLGGNTGQSNNTVTSGQSCAAGSAGCSGGHFTGNFFGQ
jgi:hypothetical protein